MKLHLYLFYLMHCTFLEERLILEREKGFRKLSSGVSVELLCVLSTCYCAASINRPRGENNRSLSFTREANAARRLWSKPKPRGVGRWLQALISRSAPSHALDRCRIPSRGGGNKSRGGTEPLATPPLGIPCSCFSCRRKRSSLLPSATELLVSVPRKHELWKPILVSLCSSPRGEALQMHLRAS